jgi:hypothetical protein
VESPFAKTRLSFILDSSRGYLPVTDEIGTLTAMMLRIRVIESEWMVDVICLTNCLDDTISFTQYHGTGIVIAARAVYRAGKATLITGTILVKVIFVTIMSYRNFSGIAFYYIF